MKNLINVNYQGKNLAIIIKNQYSSEGISFFTPDSYSQQLGYMSHPKGKIIEPHTHNKIKRNIFFTQEVLIIKKGKLRVDFYNSHQKYLESKILERGDIILLASGGHGFECIDPVEMVEVKQGPYSEELDKIRFLAVSNEQLIFND
tara:strand:+ start:1108 stop:1545 length:438 start_codon:yes stop_codon:yes gene_type:complete